MSYNYTLADIKAELSGMLHGANLNQVQNFLGVFFRATREVLTDVDVPESKVVAQVANAIYDKTYNYAAPSDLKMNKIVDLRPQVNRSLSDNVLLTTSKNFDLNKAITNNTITVENIAREKTLRINIDGETPIVLDTVNSLTENGTWTVGGDAENLTLDTVDYISGGGSLKFDLDGATTSGYVQNLGATVVDLTDHEDESALFAWVKIPDATAITSYDLKWGESLTDYWNKTVTAAHFGAFVNGWNLLRFDWSTATKTGTPDVTLSKALRMTTVYDGVAQVGLHVDNVVSILGSIWELQYYSGNIIKDGVTGTLKNEAENDTDIILLEDTTINGLLFKLAEYCSHQINQQGDLADVQYFLNSYENWKKGYTGDNKSEKQRPNNSYYSIKRRR